MKTGLVIAAATAALALSACGSSDDHDGGTKPRAGIDPSDFVRVVDNPYYPLKPGSLYRYAGEEDGVPETDVVQVTHRTMKILGVPATVVRDRVFKRGRLVESTFDWYTQDRKGNVWYFGEDTKELDGHGRVKNREGSWQAGVDGAKPGIFMPADPRVGQEFRQEYLKGHAEDHFRVVSASRHALRTEEWSPLEPEVLDAKYYVRGVGTVREKSLKGGDERLDLVSRKLPKR